jgi:hypothetical protein
MTIPIIKGASAVMKGTALSITDKYKNKQNIELGFLY